MTRTQSILLYTGVALLSLAVGILTAQWLSKGYTEKPAYVSSKPVDVPEMRVDFTLQGLDSKTRSLSEWDGKVILLNFWATWCPPCRKEMPDFIELREELDGQPFEVIGVAIDRAEPVQDFVDEIGVNYPILLAELEGLKIMLAYGNQLTTLPYSVLIDQSGKVVEAYRTEINKQQMLDVIQPLLSPQNLSQRHRDTEKIR